MTIEKGVIKEQLRQADDIANKGIGVTFVALSMLVTATFILMLENPLNIQGPSNSFLNAIFGIVMGVLIMSGVGAICLLIRLPFDRKANKIYPTANDNLAKYFSDLYGINFTPAQVSLIKHGSVERFRDGMLFHSSVRITIEGKTMNLRLDDSGDNLRLIDEDGELRPTSRV